MLILQVREVLVEKEKDKRRIIWDKITGIASSITLKETVAILKKYEVTYRQVYPDCIVKFHLLGISKIDEELTPEEIVDARMESIDSIIKSIAEYQDKINDITSS